MGWREGNISCDRLEKEMDWVMGSNDEGGAVTGGGCDGC